MTEAQRRGLSAARTWVARTVGAGLIAATAAIGSAATADAAPASVVPDPIASVVTHGNDANAAMAACQAKTHGKTRFVVHLIRIPFTDRHWWACHPALTPA
ncbi:hypothetical protein ABJI51_03415 [Amycolatopsis sp. NEAU-NG30]|uniref:Secreted protein n=1 Tax=Amycolatopsis melonis TaxID=3156488 RepID=A0ABV0L720_9PSEU